LVKEWGKIVFRKKITFLVRIRKKSANRGALVKMDRKGVYKDV